MSRFVSQEVYPWVVMKDVISSTKIYEFNVDHTERAVSTTKGSGF